MTWSLASVLIIILLALIPAAIWFIVFDSKHKIKLSTWIFSFLIWWLSSIPVLYYWNLWWIESNLIFLKITHVENYQDNIVNIFWFNNFESAINAISWDYFFIAIAASFLAYLWIWFSEEIAKHIVINPKFRWILRIILFWILAFSLINPDSIMLIVTVLLCLCFVYLAPEFIKFHSINDFVAISIFAAMWFAFFENISYFWYKWDSISYATWAFSILDVNMWNLKDLFSLVIIRITISTMVHVLCSWLFWYYYWRAFFTNPILKKDEKIWKKHFIINFLSKYTNNSKNKIFSSLNIIFWITISILLHWIYDLLVRVDLSIFDISLIIIAIPIYFLWWFIVLFTILENKCNQEEIKFWSKVTVKN